MGMFVELNPQEYLKIGKFGPDIGAAIFRSPEAMLNLRWGSSTDIWSFGATVSDVAAPYYLDHTHHSHSL